MDSVNFEIVLNYTMVTFPIKPPNSYQSLIEIIKEKFDLTIVNKLVYNDDDNEEIAIKQDSDYLKFLDFVDANELKEIDLIIKSDESKKLKAKKSLRKRSSVYNPMSNGHGASYGDDCLNGKFIIYNIYLDNYDMELEGDTRNTKYAMEDGRWSNQSYNKTELKRIYYIKEKKAMQREEQIRRETSSKQFEEPIEENVKKNKKRALKSHQDKNYNSNNNSDSQDNSEESQGKGKNFYKSKKKK
jgi:hypothetical protein